MGYQEKQLGQARPADTNAVSIYSPGTGVTGIIRTIIISNTTAVDATYRLFCDDDGVIYTEATSLFWDVNIVANTTEILSVFIPMNNVSGNFAIRSGTASAITFTLFGVEIS